QRRLPGERWTGKTARVDWAPVCRRRGPMQRLISSLFALTTLAAIPAAATDIARYILPPGNFGGFPNFTVNSTDQLPLYTGLTPLRDHITLTDIDNFYLPENFQPIGATNEEMTGRPGLNLLYDSFGIPPISGQTRAHVAIVRV